MGGRPRSDPRRLASCLAVAAILGAVLAPAAAARDNSWSLTRTPPSVQIDVATTITFLATNNSDGGGGGEIGCIEIAIPSVFSVGAVSVTSEPSGANWTDSKAGGPGGSTVVRLRAANDGSVLEGDPQNDQLGFTIRVTGSTQGGTIWTADVFKKIDCDNDMGLTKSINVTISASGQATPTPAPTPAPTPTPTAAPTPTPTPTPAPTPTPKTDRDAHRRSGRDRDTDRQADGHADPEPDRRARNDADPDPDRGAGATASPTTHRGAGSELRRSRPLAGLVGDPKRKHAARDCRADGCPVERSRRWTCRRCRWRSAAWCGIHLRRWIGCGPSDGGMFSDTFAQFTAMFGRAFDWAVPGLVLSIPGMLLVLAIAAQAIGALAWLPLVRRRIGGFGLRDTVVADRR